MFTALHVGVSPSGAAARGVMTGNAPLIGKLRSTRDAASMNNSCFFDRLVRLPTMATTNGPAEVVGIAVGSGQYQCRWERFPTIHPEANRGICAVPVCELATSFEQRGTMYRPSGGPSSGSRKGLPGPTSLRRCQTCGSPRRRAAVPPSGVRIVFVWIKSASCSTGEPGPREADATPRPVSMTCFASASGRFHNGMRVFRFHQYSRVNNTAPCIASSSCCALF